MFFFPSPHCWTGMLSVLLGLTVNCLWPQESHPDAGHSHGRCLAVGGTGQRWPLCIQSMCQPQSWPQLSVLIALRNTGEPEGAGCEGHLRASVLDHRLHRS